MKRGSWVAAALFLAACGSQPAGGTPGALAEDDGGAVATEDAATRVAATKDAAADAMSTDDATKDGSAASPDAGSDAADAGGYVIHVEGDGAPYDMVSRVVFTDGGCGGDANLRGCFGPAEAPCVTAFDVARDAGTYTDRNGDVWTLTETSIERQKSASDPTATDGVLQATATRADGTTLHLVLTFHVPEVVILC